MKYSWNFEAGSWVYQEEGGWGLERKSISRRPEDSIIRQQDTAEHTA